jgi:predicted anti-sigma-YlaC factor YlaD
MTCDDVRPLLADAATADAPPAQLAAHLAACAGCAAEAERLAAVACALREGLAAPASVTPPALEDVLAAARARAPRLARRRRAARAASYLLVLVAGALLGAALERWRREDAATPAPPPGTEAPPPAPRDDDTLRNVVAANPGGLAAALAALARP